MTELKIILGELNESLREYLESGHAKKTEELSKVYYLADMFEKARGVPGPVSFNRQQARGAWEISLRLNHHERLAENTADLEILEKEIRAAGKALASATAIHATSLEQLIDQF